MKQSGFTLLEILVAMLVLAIGLLGLAGLTTSSMRNNLSASHRTQATWMAYDIVDRMRANRASAVTGAYAGAFVPTFTNPVMKSMANHKTLSKMDRTRHVQTRNGKVQIGESYLYSNGMQHAIWWRHH